MRGSWTALLGSLLLAPPLWATEARPAPAAPERDVKPASDRLRDVEVQVRARRLLQEDRELAPLNLGVTVRDGEAVVWGAVPSPEVRAKALKKVADARGVFAVRGEMYLAPDAGLLPRPGDLRLLPDVSEQTASASPDWRTGRLPALPGRLASTKPDELTGPPKAVALKAPIILPDEGPALTGELPDLIERVRAGDARYRLIVFEVKSGAVYLRGTAKAENVMAFAKAIANLPGVERVVLQRETDPR
jgi:osmotically-inducible protein OsmY